MLVDLTSLFGKLNQTARAALEAGAKLGHSRGHYEVNTEHFLAGLLDQKGSDFDSVISTFQMDRMRLQHDLRRVLDKNKTGNSRLPALGQELIDATIRAWTYGSIVHDAKLIRSGFMLAALLEGNGPARLGYDLSSELTKIVSARFLTEFVEVVQESTESKATPASNEGAAVPARQTNTGPRVFLSYRRNDSSLQAEFVFDQLVSQVPNVSVFRDTDTLLPGMVFSEMIPETIASCDILVAIIGKKWFGASVRGGARRIDQQDDWVRLEIAEALRQGKWVIPCLTGGTRMPAKETLPPDIADLALRHAIHLSDTDLRHDVAELVDSVTKWRKSSNL